MSKFDQFKLFSTIQLQRIDQKELQLRNEILDLQIQKEYLVKFLADMETIDLPIADERDIEEIGHFQKIILKKNIKKFTQKSSGSNGVYLCSLVIFFPLQSGFRH